MDESIGDRVRRFREDRGWRREDLASRAEVSVAALTDIENNVTKNPQRSTLRGIAAAFDVTVEDITGEEPEPAVLPSGKEQAELLDLYQQLRGDYRRSALLAVRGLLREQREMQRGREGPRP